MDNGTSMPDIQEEVSKHLLVLKNAPGLSPQMIETSYNKALGDYGYQIMKRDVDPAELRKWLDALNDSGIVAFKKHINPTECNTDLRLIEALSGIDNIFNPATGEWAKETLNNKVEGRDYLLDGYPIVSLDTTLDIATAYKDENAFAMLLYTVALCPSAPTTARALYRPRPSVDAVPTRPTRSS